MRSRSNGTAAACNPETAGTSPRSLRDDGEDNVIRHIEIVPAWPAFIDRPWRICWVHLSPDAKRGTIELIVARHAPEDWGDVWYLDISMLDEAGVVDEIAACLASIGLTVDQVQNTPSGEYLVVRYTLTARGYRSPAGEGHLERLHGQGSSLADVRRLIEVRFIERLRFLDRRPVVAITHNAALARLRHAHFDNQRQVEAAQQLIGDGGRFTLPQHAKSHAEAWIARHHRVAVTDLRTPVIARCHDESGHFLKFVIGYAETGLALYSSREPIKGSVADLTDRLRRNHYDIIASSLETQHDSCFGSLVVRDLLVAHKPTSPPALNARLERVVRGQTDDEGAAAVA